MSLEDFVIQPIPPTLLTPDATAIVGQLNTVEQLLDLDDELNESAWKLLPNVIALVDMASQGRLDKGVASAAEKSVVDALNIAKTVEFAAKRKNLPSAQVRQVVARRLLLQIYLEELRSFAEKPMADTRIELLNTLLHSVGIVGIKAEFSNAVDFNAERK